MVQGLLKMQFACEIQKKKKKKKKKIIMSDRKTEYSPLNAENNRGVCNDIMFAYVHTKINILLSVKSICFSFLRF